MANKIDENNEDSLNKKSGGKRGRPRKTESSENSSNLDDELGSNSNNNNNNNNIDIKSLENDSFSHIQDAEIIEESNSNIENNNSEDTYDVPPEDVNLEQDVAIESNSQDLTDVNDDIPDMDFDPLAPPVKKRGYTTGQIDGAKDSGTGEKDVEAEKKFEEKIPEPEIKNPTYENLPPKDDKGKKNTGGGDGGSGGGNKGTGGDDEKFDLGDDSKGDKKKETPNSKLDDLSPAQKRKAAEKAADAVLLAYQKFVPKPFKAMSSFNMRKLQIMEMKNEISLDVSINDSGTTIKEYCEDINEQVENIFVITEEMKQEIKEPLVDVLLENNLALTPTQRLLMAVGGQVVQMTMTAAGFMQQNKHALSEFKRFHTETLEVKRETMREAENRFKNENNSNTNTNTNNNTNSNQQENTNSHNSNAKTTPPPPPPNNETVNDTNDDIPSSDANEDVPNFEEETTSESNNEPVIKEQKDEKITPTVDEYLTEENGGITVEEVKPDADDDIDGDF